MARKSKRISVIDLLSDDDDDENYEPKEEETTEFYSNELKLWINIDNSKDWKVLDFQPNLDYIFKKLKDKYFKSAINTEYEIVFDNNHALDSDNSAFRIFQRFNKIVVAQNVCIRPRIEQISIVLHILIHLYLNQVSNDNIGISKHDDNFRSIMHHLNEKLGTSITFNHKIQYVHGEEDYNKQWWLCTGICQNYDPFKGFIRSTMTPNESMIFWKFHHYKCAGTFFKVIEIQKTNLIDETTKKYLRSTCYMDPKTHNFDQGNKTVKSEPKLPVREKVDLTNDTDSPVVNNLCEVVDLDESQYNIDVSNPKYFENFKKKTIFGNVTDCPFCFQNIGTSRLASHFDVCMGHQNAVQHCIPMFVPWKN